METNTIRRLLEYYFKAPDFALHIERAFSEFFNDNSSMKINDDLGGIDESVMFNEWLVFDFKLDNDKTLLQDFYECNPENLTSKALKIYKDLQKNTYSFFEIIKINIGKGLELLDLYAGKKYYVREKSLTYQVKKGLLFFGRIGRVGRHFELVGSHPITYGNFIELGQNARDFFKDIKEKLNPKLLKDVVLEKDVNQPYKKFSLYQAKKELKSILAHYKLKDFVSINLVLKWINNIKWKKHDIIPVNILTMLIGLSDNFMIDETDKALEIINFIYNNTLQKKLKNKTPAELFQKRQFQNKDPEFVFNSRKIDYGKSHKLQEKARKLMAKGKHEQAEKKFKECFEEFHKQRTTSSQIYRVFANYAMSNLYSGKKELGLKFLKIALELNPNYDFALMAMNYYKKGHYDDIIFMANLKCSVKTILSQDPAYIYYQYLKQFKINFKTKKLTKSKITKFKETNMLKNFHNLLNY